MKRSSMLAGMLVAPALGKAAGAAPATDLQPLRLATGWLGERPAPASLRGRVVVLDIFTFECINCTHVTPNLKRLFGAYSRSDLVVVAVHTPEVPSYQRNFAYVARQARAAELPWPIAIDNNHRIWDAFDVSAWPTQLIFDRGGRLQATIVGEGLDARVTRTVRALAGAG